jgi:hypothetical protein
MMCVLSSMTAIVESALATKGGGDTDTRAALGKKFNDLLVQLSTLADDSAYGGTKPSRRPEHHRPDGRELTTISTFTVEGFYVAGLTHSTTPDTT